MKHVKYTLNRVECHGQVLHRLMREDGQTVLDTGLIAFDMYDLAEALRNVEAYAIRNRELTSIEFRGYAPPLTEATYGEHGMERLR